MTVCVDIAARLRGSHGNAQHTVDIHSHRCCKCRDIAVIRNSIRHAQLIQHIDIDILAGFALCVLRDLQEQMRDHCTVCDQNARRRNTDRIK